jgi:hypothetical protein
MMRRVLFPLTVLASVVLFAAAARSQQTITEPSTEKSFASTVTYAHGGKDYALTATGTAVRKKLMFRVYGMVHYMQDPLHGPRESVYKDILTDGKAKQITMNFARDVTSAQITDAYRDGFKENATKEEMASLQPVLNKFLGYFTEPVKENDIFTLRWIPGGTIVPIIRGKEFEALTNATFARVLWSIWFGEDSIVDREDLVALTATK